MNKFAFEINGTIYQIKEVSQSYLAKQMGEESETHYCYGQTHFPIEEILIDKSQSYQRKRKTLFHELMHIYIREYLTTADISLDEELMCDISANSHDIIHEIVEEYFEVVKDD